MIPVGLFKCINEVILVYRKENKEVRLSRVALGML